MYGSNFWRVTRYPCPSSKQPIDAAARPLPSDDTTPPVTKMYLTDRPSLFCMAPSSIDGGRQTAPHPFEVFEGVHTDGVVLRFHDLQPEPVLEGPQLLEGLGFLERSRGQPCESQQRFPPVDVEADVLPGHLPAWQRGRRAQ